MPITLNGDTGIQTPMYNGTITANAVTPVTGFKNRIINGAMVIDQRNAGASVTQTTDFLYCLDRWFYTGDSSSKYTVQQNAGSVTPPVGFTNYLGVTSSSAYTVTSGQSFIIGQRIEGFNFADLQWGTANAKTVTLSFWVRSSLTGTFGGAFMNSAANRSYPFSYSISSANTWEYKTVTVAGDTTGTWVGATNGIGVRMIFSLGAGSSVSGTAGAWTGADPVSVTGATSVVGTNGATFFLTGVQLEVGSTATSFDYRPYGTELALCQRYYVEFPLSSQMAAYTASATEIVGTVNLPVQLRATPSVTSTGGSKYGWYDTSYDSSSSNTVSMATTGSLATYAISQAGFGGLTTLRSRVLQSDNAYKFSAEL